MRLLKLALSVTLLFGVAPAFAQSDLDAELSGEVDALYDQLPQAPRVRRKVQRKVVRAPRVVTEDIQVQKIYVPQEPVEEVRPTLTVEATPLKESKASRLRQQRESIEAQTELRIVEQLEEDRMRSERERAARIFGNKQIKKQERDPIYERSSEQELDYQELRQDIREMVDELKEPRKAQVVNRSHEVYDVEDYNNSGVDKKFYIGGSVGTGSYPGVENIDGVYSFGLQGGYRFDGNLSVEFGYNLSSYDVEDPYSNSGYYPYSGTYTYVGSYYSQPVITEMDQHSLSLGVNYKFMENSRIRPVVGALVAYTMREYSESVYSGYRHAEFRTDSSAFDLGLQGGAEVELGKRFSVGLDLRYMFNLTNDVRRQQAYNPYNFYYNDQGVEKIEELKYFLFNINAKFLF